VVLLPGAQNPDRAVRKEGGEFVRGGQKGVLDGPATGAMALEEENIVIVDMWADPACLGCITYHAVCYVGVSGGEGRRRREERNGIGERGLSK